MIDDRTPNLNLPLPNVDNTLAEDVARLRSAFTALDSEVDARQLTSEKGVAGGYPSLDGSGKVPTSQLPTIVEDSDDVPEGAVNRYFTDARARAAQAIATGSVLGLVKVGAGLSVSGDGTLSTVGGGGGEGVPAFNELILVPASNGQTVFTPAGGYEVGEIELYLNGVLLYGNGDDYSASNGTTITLTFGVTTSDLLLLRRWTTSLSFPFSALTDKPTTLAGYGITDAMALAGNQTVAGTKTFSSAIVASITGNAATATNLSTNSTNWATNGTISAVVGLLGWKNFSNNHVIFDASASTAPNGSAVNNTNAANAWIATYPTLMGWNGSATYGVRVDSARVSDSTTGNAATVTNGVYTAGDQTIGGIKTFSSPPVYNENVQVISTNTTAVKARTYVLTASLTLTLPASPAAGDWVTVINRSGTVTPIVGRNAQNIMGLAEDMTLNDLNASVTLVFADATRGWVFS